MPNLARLLFPLLAAALFASSAEGDALRRVPIMRTDAVVPEAGAANLLLHDVYGTAAPEIVTCSMESAYALTARGGDYVPVWRTPEVECSAVRIGDIDGDGDPDAVVGSKPYPNGAGAIYVFEPRGFGPPRASVTLPGNAGANDVAIGNVDADPAIEIVVITNSSLYVYDAVTLALEWSTPAIAHSVGIVRDVGGSPLGVDRPATQRIQSLGFRVTFAPASAVTAASFTPAGVLAGSALFEESYDAAYVVSFAEAGHALSFTPDGAAPGNLIGYLDVTTSSALSPGTAITMIVDPATATLSNEAGTIVETFANRRLALQNGTITVTATCPAASVTGSIVGNAGACTAGTGGTATAAVDGVSGASLQWGWRATPGGAITPIANATGTSYTIAGADFGGAGTKFLVVSAAWSCSQAVSNELAVTISSTPNVTIDASSGVYAGSTANYASVVAQGAGATYAWTVTNGTITSGEGTRAIQYTAGASGQVGIDVVVTASGCGGSSSPHADVAIISRPAGASLLYLISPCRILDTRGGPPLASGWEEEVAVSGVCGIPAGAKSIAANITVVAPSTSGYLALYPSDGIWPGTSTVNYRTGRTRANNTIVRLSADGHVTVRNAGASAHFLIDVTGYFQ